MAAEEFNFELPLQNDGDSEGTQELDLFGFDEFMEEPQEVGEKKPDAEPKEPVEPEQPAEVEQQPEQVAEAQPKEKAQPADVQALLAQQAQQFNSQIQGLSSQIQMLQQAQAPQQQPKKTIELPKPEDYDDDPAGWTAKFYAAKEAQQQQANEQYQQDNQARDIARRQILEGSFNKAKQILPMIESNQEWGEAFKKVYFGNGYDKSDDGPMLAALTLKSMYLEQQSNQAKNNPNDIGKAVAQDRSRQQRVATQAMHGSGTNSKAESITLSPEMETVRKNMGIPKDKFIKQFQKMSAGGEL